MQQVLMRKVKKTRHREKAPLHGKACGATGHFLTPRKGRAATAVTMGPHATPNHFVRNPGGQPGGQRASGGAGIRISPAGLICY
jgi:hypothetical protein